MRLRPTKEEFVRLAAAADLIPVTAEVPADLETPVSAFLKLSGGGPAYLLESVEGGDRLGRYSFIGFSPERVATVRGRRVAVLHAGGREEVFDDEEPLRRVLDMTRGHRLPEGTVLPPFAGGAVGYLSYDCARYFERIPDANPDPLGLPEAVLLFCHRYLVFDRVTNRLTVAVNAPVEGNPEKAYDAAAALVAEAAEALKRAPVEPPPAAPAGGEPASSLSGEEYQAVVRECLEHIRRGDILQVVPSVRFSLPFAGHPFSLYRALRVLNPSPYMFYLDLGGFQLVGSSPETMVKLEGNRVSMNPIAGTRPRGASAAEDATLEQDLLADGKEAAEHLMLVDLARNDLGRISLPGTVKVSSFRRVERFSHVMHLVSTVEGTVPTPADVHEVIRAVFPAGTVSGAPKIRAMEIIDEVETVRRGPYAGLVGYFDYRGNMDSCITIRTVVAKDGLAHIQAGAGIVADSRPEREYLECRQKAEALFRAVRLAQGGEE